MFQMFQNNNYIKGWAMVERTTGSQLQDEAMAVVLTLSKAVTQDWQNIEVHIHNKKLLKAY